MSRARALLVGGVLLSFPYIGLELRLDLPGWALNVPLADLAAAGLVALAAWGPRAPPLPGVLGFGLLILAGLAALPAAPDPAQSAWTLLRKPVFLWLAYGLAFARAVVTAPVLPALRAGVGLAAAVLLVSSVERIASGLALWWSPIAGLTNNHKTLAVALSPTLPLLLGVGRTRLDRALAALVVVALLASVSRTAWISAATGLAWFVPFRGRPLAERPAVVPGIVVVGLALALIVPVWSGSMMQLDAARSRHSLNLRAWTMFREHPLFGMGLGSNVVYEMVTYPHYRVNGVDAHGVFQKLASETGLVGLVGWLAGTWSTARAIRPHRALWASFVALHVNLLLSTETFSQTHWAVLGLLWGLAARPADDR